MARSRRDRAAALLLAAALGLGVSCVPGVAHADEGITTQPYLDPTGLAQLKARGLDGTGVTIAIIDSPVDTSVPELAGADITTAATCRTGGASHGTTVLSFLADATWGWAPNARFLTYAVKLLDPRGIDSLPTGCEGSTDDMINRAINDGADVINISATLTASPGTLIRAALRGVPIVIAAGNDGESQQRESHPATATQYNTLVNVGATDMSGRRSSYSQYGTGLTVMAPGDPLTCREADWRGDLTKIDDQCAGTSFATPMVVGALALAMQQWPNANGNQLIASLIATSDRVGGTPDWDEKYGWGTFDPIELVDNDPSRYPADNPLRDAIPSGRPTAKDFADYHAGTMSSSWISKYDTDYRPRTVITPTPTPTPTPTAPTTTAPVTTAPTTAPVPPRVPVEPVRLAPWATITLVVLLVGGGVALALIGWRAGRAHQRAATAAAPYAYPVWPQPVAAPGPAPGAPGVWAGSPVTGPPRPWVEGWGVAAPSQPVPPAWGERPMYAPSTPWGPPTYSRAGQSPQPWLAPDGSPVPWLTAAGRASLAWSPAAAPVFPPAAPTIPPAASAASVVPATPGAGVPAIPTDSIPMNPLPTADPVFPTAAPTAGSWPTAGPPRPDFRLPDTRPPAT